MTIPATAAVVRWAGITAAQLELVIACAPRIEDQAAARRALRGLAYESLRGGMWEHCMEQSARALRQLLGLPSPTPTARTVDVCEACHLEADGDTVCCPGANIVRGPAGSRVAALGIERVTETTLSVAQVRAVHAQLLGLAATTSSQRILRAACERLLDDGRVSDVALMMTIDEIQTLGRMTQGACRALVAAAWNDATPSLQVVRS